MSRLHAAASGAGPFLAESVPQLECERLDGGGIEWLICRRALLASDFDCVFLLICAFLHGTWRVHFL
jgi:hypothetical protein